MYKLIFESSIEDKIEAFIDSIYKNNIELYKDCGIENLDFIEKNYLEHSQMMRKKIIQEITKSGESEIVGKMQTDTGTIFSVRVANFRMFVHYEEDVSSKTRFLESIEFFRK